MLGGILNLFQLNLNTDGNMNVDQHLKVAMWHMEQARLHAEKQHSCGCPINDEYKRIINDVESGKITEELVCKVK